MEYPYDKPDFSPFTKAFLGLLRKHPPLENPVDLLLEPIGGGLPAESAALLHTLAHHSFPRTDLGWRELYYRGDDAEPEPMGRLEDFNVADDAPHRFDVSKGMLLGESIGGEVYFGIHWDRGGLHFFEIDVQDELGEPIKEFDAADSFWGFIAASEYDYAEMEGSEAPAFLVELHAAAGQTLNWPV